MTEQNVPLPPVDLSQFVRQEAEWRFNQAAPAKRRRSDFTIAVWRELISREVQLQQALNENVELKERLLDMEAIEDSQHRAVMQNDSLRDKIAALGWHKLKPDTQWESGSQVGSWHEGIFVFSAWTVGWGAKHLLATADATYYYRRLNPPPPQEETND